VLSSLLIAAVAIIVLKTELLARLAARLQQDRPRPWIAAFACAGALLLAVTLVKLPLDVAGGWLADRTRLGPTAPVMVYLARAWGRDFTLCLALTFGAGLLIGLARQAPRSWWAWTGVPIVLAVIALAWGPYAAQAGSAPLPPLPAGEARDGLLKLIQDAHLSARQIYLVASPEVDGDVTGLPGQARVTVDQGMIDHASVPEMRAAIGHLAGHFVHGDQFGLAALLAALGLFSLIAIDRLHGPVSRALGEGRLNGPGDPVGAPIWLVLAVVLTGAGTVAERAYIRWINVRADQFSLDHARAPDGLAINLVRNWRDDNVDPGPLEEAIFFDHPSLQSRLTHAMRWKAEHGEAGSTAQR